MARHPRSLVGGPWECLYPAVRHTPATPMQDSVRRKAARPMTPGHTVRHRRRPSCHWGLWQIVGAGLGQAHPNSVAESVSRLRPRD